MGIITGREKELGVGVEAIRESEAPRTTRDYVHQQKLPVEEPLVGSYSPEASRKPTAARDQ